MASGTVLKERDLPGLCAPLSHGPSEVANQVGLGERLMGKKESLIPASVSDCQPRGE